MEDKQKFILKICKGIWNFQKGPGIWVDKEDEPEEPEKLIYKRLDGLRALLTPIFMGDLSIADYNFINKQHMVEEIRSLVDYLSAPNQHFYPTPHTFTPTPQPDDYIDMAAHCLSFISNCLRCGDSFIDNDTRKVMNKLGNKAFSVLTDRDNYFRDAKGHTSSWAGTTLYKSSEGVSLKNVYFTSQAILALNDWLTGNNAFLQTPSQEVIEKVKTIIKEGCAWILSQRHHSDKILTMDESGEDQKSINQIIMANVDGLIACITSWNLIDIGAQQRTREIAGNFIDFLKTHKPDSKTWYYQVKTKEVGYQHYQERQDCYGIVTCLGLIKEVIGITWIAKTDEAAEHFAAGLFQNDINELLIGSLPWFVSDIHFTIKYFPGLSDTILVSQLILRKAIVAAVNEPAFLDTLTRELSRHLIEINQKNIQTIKESSKPEKHANRSTKRNKNK